MTEAKPPYHLNEPQIEIERISPGVYRIHSTYDGDSIAITVQALRDIESWLQINMIRIEAEASGNTQPAEDIAQRLAALDSLEMEIDELEEKLCSETEEYEAILAWRSL